MPLAYQAPRRTCYVDFLLDWPRSSLCHLIPNTSLNNRRQDLCRSGKPQTVFNTVVVKQEAMFFYLFNPILKLLGLPLNTFILKGIFPSPLLLPSQWPSMSPKLKSSKLWAMRRAHSVMTHECWSVVCAFCSRSWLFSRKA